MPATRPFNSLSAEQLQIARTQIGLKAIKWHLANKFVYNSREIGATAPATGTYLPMLVAGAEHRLRHIAQLQGKPVPKPKILAQLR